MPDMDMVSKAEVLDIFAELYDEFDDAPGIIKVLHKVCDKLKRLQPQEPVVSLTVSDWIGVKDRLPRDQDIVIVAINDNSGDTSYKYTYFGWYMSEAKCWIVDDEIRRGEVYAWRPLPKPPEVSENG